MVAGLMLSGTCMAQSPRDLLRKARSGNVAAMRALGKKLIQGDGVPRDASSGVQWLQKAASAGDSSAMLMLGDLHHNGIAVSKNESKALEYYEKAAKAGNKNAAKRLAQYNEDAPESSKKEQASTTEKSATEPTRTAKEEKENLEKDFFDALARADIEQVKQCIAKGVNVNATGSEKQTAITIACASTRSDELVRLLVKSGAKVNHENSNLVPYHCNEASKSRSSLVRFLLESGAKVEERDIGITMNLMDILDRKMNANTTECVKLLLDAGASPNVIVYGEKTALHFAAERGATDIVKLLIQAGADITVQNTKATKNIRGTHVACNALLYAAMNGHEETAKVIREALKNKQ